MAADTPIFGGRPSPSDLLFWILYKYSLKIDLIEFRRYKRSTAGLGGNNNNGLGCWKESAGKQYRHNE